MVRPINTFRYLNSAYRRQQHEIHKLSQLKSGRGATPEENYDEEYVNDILTERADSNLKYGSIETHRKQNEIT